jgi:hypothetical protein
VNPHLQKAHDDYTSIGVDFMGLLSWHLKHGCVHVGPGSFAMGYHADSRGDVMRAVLYEHSDTLFATYLTGDMREASCAFIDRYEFVAFQRFFKGIERVRIHRISDIFKKLT